MKNQKYTLGSLFDGAGTVPFAAQLCGAEPIWASEIEKFPIEVTTKRFPNMKHLGDITKLNGAEIPPVDIIAFGSPCLVGDTLITTDNGYVPIRDIKIGDRVLTHNNRYMTVTNWALTQNDAEVMKLSTMGGIVEATSNHRFWVRTKGKIWDNSHRVYKRVFDEPHWKELKDMDKSDYVGCSVNTACENPKNLTNEECYLLGRYVADGYIKDKLRPHRKNSYYNLVTFCIGKSKILDFEKRIDMYHISKSEERTAYKCHIYSNRLMELCGCCGKGAINKHIPEFILNLPTNLLQDFLDGYMSGDGCFTKGCYCATSISEKLIYGIGQIVAKLYRRPYRVYYVEKSPTTIIEGRIVNQHNYYMIRWKLENSKQDKAFYDRGYIWFPIKDISKSTNQDVYDITVEEDHSFCANNIITHNCQNLSVAGNRKGLHGDQSSLFMDAIRVIKEMRGATNGDYPKIAIWENVTGAFSSNFGEDFRIVLKEFCNIKGSKIDVPRPNEGWSDAGFILGDGYSIAWRVLDAQYWGLPQRRKRIYLVGDFRGGCAGEILFKREGLSRSFAESRESWQGFTKSLAVCP